MAKEIILHSINYIMYIFLFIFFAYSFFKISKINNYLELNYKIGNIVDEEQSYKLRKTIFFYMGIIVVLFITREILSFKEILSYVILTSLIVSFYTVFSKFKELKNTVNVEAIKKNEEDKTKLKKILKREKIVQQSFGKTEIPSYDETMMVDDSTDKKKIAVYVAVVILGLIIIGFCFPRNIVSNFEKQLKARQITLNENFVLPKTSTFSNLTFKEKANKKIENLELIKTNNYYLVKLSEKNVLAKGIDNAISIQEKENENFKKRIIAFEESIKNQIAKGVKNTDKQKSILENAVKQYNEKVQNFNAISQEKQRIDDLKAKLELELSIWNLFYYIFGGYSLIAFILTVNIIGTLNKKEKERKENEELTSHGNAKWGKLEDTTKGKTSVAPFANEFLETTGVVIGKVNGHCLRDNAKTHLLLSAPTRTGKGVSIIIPSLIDSWFESCFVLDIKGENYQLTSGWRKIRFNNKIIKLAPMQSSSAKFNPLDEVRVAFEGGLKEGEDIASIAALLAQDDSGGQKDPFWDENGSIYLQCFITLAIYLIRKSNKEKLRAIREEGREPTKEEIVMYSRKACFADIDDIISNNEANFSKVQDYYKFLAGMDINKNGDKSQNPEDKKPLYGAKVGQKIKHFAAKDDYQDEEDKKLIAVLKSIYPTNIQMIDEGIHPEIQKKFAKIVTMSENMFGSVKAVGETKLKVFNTPIVKYNTSSSDFRIWDLMNYKEPISLYLIIEPKDLKELASYARILLILIVNLLTGEQDYTTGASHKWRLLLMLDEFPAVGKMEVLEKAIGFVAGYGMKIVVVLQSLDQLYKIYTKENMFTGNCQTQIFYTANENGTAQYVSETCGSQTIIFETKSDKKLGGALNRVGDTRQSRKLLSVDEFRKFPLDRILVKPSGKDPLMTEKLQYFKEPEYKGKTRIPYTLTEGLDRIMNYQEIENPLSYKLNPDTDNYLDKYQIFYKESNKTYGTESSFYGYYKANYVLDYIKQPVIFGKYHTHSVDGSKKFYGFAGELINRFNYNKKSKEYLAHLRTKLIYNGTDTLVGVEGVNSSEKLLNDVLDGKGVFELKKDKNNLFNLPKGVNKESGELEYYTNSELYQKIKGTETTEKIIPINTSLIVDLDKTDKDRAETLFYGAKLFESLMEIVKDTLFNKDIEIQTGHNLSDDIKAMNNYILTSKSDFYENIFNIKDSSLAKGFDECYFRDSDFESTRVKNSSISESLDNIYKNRIFNRISTKENITSSFNKMLDFINTLNKDTNKDTKVEARLKELEEKKNEVAKKVITMKDVYIFAFNRLEEIRKELFINGANLLKEEIDNLKEETQYLENLLNTLFGDIINEVNETRVFVNCDFEITDPQTTRKITHNVYVPIKMKLVVNILKRINSAMSKSEINNEIIRELFKYLRNNNANWIQLEKDLKDAEKTLKQQMEDMLIRKKFITQDIKYEENKNKRKLKEFDKKNKK